ncbi:thiolase family protein [Euzebya tangerina]|uniref:thiolase family protein n=1 Tax=Euzebya tangerina TaxID=591198 RepID=UPI000E30D0C6|nr:thiolase family protein [Euzebya tangerina]
MPIAGDVAIVGLGVTPFGVLTETGYLDLVADASFAALADAGLQPEDLDAAWLGTAEPLLAGLVGDSAAAVAEALRHPLPASRVSNFCTSGMEAVRHAAMAVAAGEAEVVLAVGAEKMRDVTPRESLVAKTSNQTHPTLSKGRTAPGQFALIANRYLHVHGEDPAALAQVAVKNHRHATRNPKAHYRTEVTVEEVTSAPRVADPLGLLDCTPTTDGAAAVIVTSRDWAEQHARQYALIDGVGLFTLDGYFAMHTRSHNDFLGFEATRRAAAIAYEQAGITSPRDELDVVECHDCFTITEIVNTEDLGLVERGGGVDLLRSGATSAGGDIPVNLSGGLLSCGHPVGATGVRMVAEIADQVMGRAGDRQVPGATRGLAHTLGGPGAISAVMVLSAP